MASIAPWVCNIYENEISCAWIGSLVGSDNPNIVFDAIERVVEASDGELDARIILEGLAAYETLTRYRINFESQDTASEVIIQSGGCRMRLPTPELVVKALAGIDRILSLPSELDKEEADYSDYKLFIWWLDYVGNLQLRITRIINDNPDYDWESIPGYPRE